MNAQELFRAGKLAEAVKAVSAEIRDNPADLRRRTFLFELLCFTGDYDRAQKHLAVIGQEGGQIELGAVLYRSCLAADKARQEIFAAHQYPAAPGEPALERPGTLNGRPFRSITDADPRIGARLEVFAAGQYLLIPLEHVVAIQLQPPQKLRDLLWSPAAVLTGPAFRDKDLGELMLPVLTGLSYQDPEDDAKLGRITAWREDAAYGAVPVGQKMLIVDEEETVPLLELRELTFTADKAAASS